MTSFTDNRELIRRYLLRDVDEDTEARLDERVLADQAFFETVELVEDDLIEEYQRGETRAPERQAVEAFLTVPERRRALHLTCELARRFERVPAAQTRASGMPARKSSDRLKAPAGWQQWATLAAAASLLLSCGTAIFFGVQSSRLRAELQSTIASYTTQLRDLDRRLSEASAPPPAVLSFLLLPDVSQRSMSDPPVRFELPASAERIALHLDLASIESSATYRVTVRRVGGPQIWGDGGLRRQDGQSPQLIVTIPAAILRPEDYVINLFGADGQQLADYRLRVVSR